MNARNDNDVLTIVLGGGKGARLFPLTMNRAKPAVPFGAKYRLVDIPLSNSIVAGFKKIYVLTQFNSASLHLHIANTYLFDSFTRGFCEILAAEQTFDHTGWYEGTGDAVRKNFIHFRIQRPSHYIILSGDQLYRMDLADFYRKHLESGCTVSVAATTVTREQAIRLGILTVDGAGKITEFTEKPPIEKDISSMRVPAHLHPNKEQFSAGREYLASMGIYCFNADAMEHALDNTSTDFGKDIIPALIGSTAVNAHIYTGFWEDIGTIKSFYDTNLDLTSINPSFNFYLEDSPIFTHKRDLPPSKFSYCVLNNALAADGCIVTNSKISDSLIGVRTRIESGAEFSGVFCMGADYYESEEERAINVEKGLPNVGIGRDTRISHAIVDKNTRIGDGCVIGQDPASLVDGDFDNYYVRDGIIVIPKNAVVPSGTVI
ncbi:MAG: glucose-1-phosphate adenylyltransferase [Spirochaetia bacterium]